MRSGLIYRRRGAVRGHKMVMSRIVLLSALFPVVFLVACGSSSSNNPSGPFSNASLNGQYVYQIRGTDFTTNANGAPYRESGVFAANGAQAITGGIDDFVEGGGGVATNTTSGSYAINNDGTGSISLNVGTSTITFAVTMVTTAKVYLIEADAGVNASGLAELQSSSAITSVPNGTFAFRSHILNVSQVPTGTVGALTIAGSAVTSGNQDSITLGATDVPLVVTGGTFSTPDANGRGTFSLNSSIPATTNFFYYIVDGNNIRFFDRDLTFMGLASAEKQTAPLTFSGTYAFGSRGDTNNLGLGGSNTVGVFTSNGSSAISAGAFDSVQDGNQSSNIAFTGNFTTVDAHGRTVATLSTGQQLLAWMVNSSRGFFIFNDATRVEDGTFDSQLGTGFSNSTMDGQFGFAMDGFDLIAGANLNRVGTLQWDGNGHLTLNEASNSGSGAVSPGTLTGSYTVAGNGRVQGTITNLSESNGDLIFYLISGNDAYVLESDAGVEIAGTISKQPSQ
jgi:hypothetical protein